MDDLKIVFHGYGQWMMSTTYYGKRVYLYTTDSVLIDDINDGNQSAIKTAIKMIRRVAKEKL